MKNGAAPILLIIVLLFLIGAIYFIYKSNNSYPRPTPTSVSKNYKCPQSNYINCMPQVIPNGGTPNPTYQQYCNPDYLSWAKINCPNLKGTTY